MADQEEPAQPQSIQERIAALKLGQVGRVPGQQPQNQVQPPKNSPATGRPRPPPPPRPTVPPRPAVDHRTASANNPPVRDHASSADRIGNMPEEPRPNGASANGMDGISRPCLPPRTSTASTNSSLGPALPPRKPSQPSPSLPPRRPSDMALSRRESNESISSIGTMRSSVSGKSNGTSMTSRSDRYAVRAPEFDPSALPALPPKRTQEEKDAQAAKDAMRRPSRTSNAMSGMLRKGSAPNVPARSQSRPPPPLPGRTEARQEQPTPAPESMPAPAPRRTEPPPPRKSALAMGFGTANSRPSQSPQPPTERSSSVPAEQGAPPPIPTASRPDLAALQASKPKLNGSGPAPVAAGPGACLHCRDFSGPDNHAARFPRESIPSTDVDWLAYQLTSPFPNITDKARAIFTWLHHNVAYDVVALHNNAVKPSTPQGTIASGLAVCEGFAGLFAALALKSGLEAIVVSGASKGGGYVQQKPNDPIPPFKSTHAWNAVRLDTGEWKLIDPCWGAGSVGNRVYNKRFAPQRFTQSNDDFGRDHYPTDNSKQLRNDGRILSWEEYNVGTKDGTAAKLFNGVSEEGLARGSFSPLANPIVLAQQGPTVRFSFQKVCPHWDPMRNGRGAWYLYVLHLEGLDGTKRNHVPFEQGDGVWWCDVPVSDMGRPGMKAQIYTVTSIGGKDGRGLTIQEYREKKGRTGMSFGGVGLWQIG